MPKILHLRGVWKRLGVANILWISLANGCSESPLPGESGPTLSEISVSGLELLDGFDRQRTVTQGDFARAVIFVRSGAERSAGDAATELQRKRWAPAGFAQQPGQQLVAGESAGLIARAMRDVGPDNLSDQKAFETLRARGLLRAGVTPSTAVSGPEALALLTGLRETLDEDELEGPSAFVRNPPPSASTRPTIVSGAPTAPPPARPSPPSAPVPGPIEAPRAQASAPPPATDQPESFDEFDASPIKPAPSKPPAPGGSKPAPSKPAAPAKPTPVAPSPAIAAGASSTLPRARREPLPDIPPMTAAADAPVNPLPIKPAAPKKKSPWGAGKPIPQRPTPPPPPAGAAGAPKGGG